MSVPHSPDEAEHIPMAGEAIPVARVSQELRLVVTFLPECAQWRWELRRGSAIVESSWASHWLAYPSRTEAAKAGAKRLTALQDATARATAATPPEGSDESTRDAA